MDVSISLQNKNVPKLKKNLHIAVHFDNVQDKVSVKTGVQNSCRYLSAQLEHSSNV